MHALAWSVDELQRLIQSGSKATVELQVLSEIIEEDRDMIRANVARKMSEVKSILASIVKGVYQYRRVVATHVLVIMISTESRSLKPYALPVQCIPYASLRDSHVRDLLNTVIKEMVKLGMKVAGKLMYSSIYILIMQVNVLMASGILYGVRETLDHCPFYKLGQMQGTNTNQ